MEKEKLLKKYKLIWDKINEISEKTDAIIKTSAVGQHPPCFDILLDKQVRLINDKALPIWEELKSFINKDFKTFWQIANWRKGSMPPNYYDLISK